MKAHLIDTHLLVPRLRSSEKVKVKYQGHVSQKMGVSGALVFNKQVFFFFSRGEGEGIMHDIGISLSVCLQLFRSLVNL